jgi:formylglycine-generating enzyme required for sulfatase activity
MSGSEAEHLRELIKAKKDQLHQLELKKARHGLDLPPHIYIEIEKLRGEMEGLQAELAALEKEQKAASRLKKARRQEEARPARTSAKPHRRVNWEKVGARAGVIAVFVAVIGMLIAWGAWLVPNVTDFLFAWLSPTPATPALLTDMPTLSAPLVMERVQSFEPEMILIPAGVFLMGSDPSVDKDAFVYEMPQHTLYLPDFYMSKTEVTNAQYAAFVGATGHDSPKHWDGGKLPSGKEDHPVVYVSWYDAMAYCNWLAEVTDKPYRLPSEAEWEKGARGSDGRIWPWGNQWDAGRCNCGEGEQRDTTPVGAYPEGASPYGLLDMAGNAWEWTRSRWGGYWGAPSFRYPYDPGDGREDLEAKGLWVLRGGSINVGRNVARCSFRLRDDPDYHLWYFGFRVVVSPVSPPLHPDTLLSVFWGEGGLGKGVPPFPRV